MSTSGTFSSPRSSCERCNELERQVAEGQAEISRLKSVLTTTRAELHTQRGLAQTNVEAHVFDARMRLFSRDNIVSDSCCSTVEDNDSMDVDRNHIVSRRRARLPWRVRMRQYFRDMVMSDDSSTSTGDSDDHLDSGGTTESAESGMQDGTTTDASPGTDDSMDNGNRTDDTIASEYTVFDSDASMTSETNDGNGNLEPEP